MNNFESQSKQIKVLNDFNEFLLTPFEGEINVHCLERNLLGDFKEIVEKLELKENITEILVQDLLQLELSDNGKIAREIIISDLQKLSEIGASPSLNLIKNYERDDFLDCISTDVYSFHVDSSPIETHTYLCTYFGASSEILPNDLAIQKIKISDIREQLELLHKNYEVDFETFLEDFHFDLHYQSKPNVKPINLGLGNLWKLAVKHPQQKVLPCIHRAPIENKNELRLLLIC